MKNVEQLEREWREEQSKHDFGKEILESMSYREARELLAPLFEERIKHMRELDKLFRQILRIVTKYHAPDTIEHIFCLHAAWIMRGADEDIRNQSELQRIESLYLWNESRKPQSTHKSITSWQNNALLISLAKRIPIENLFSDPLKQSGKSRIVGHCPFRQEKHGSFTIYTSSNTFFCFGCHAKGDSITFYQKLYCVTFWDAVKQLTGTN